MRSQRTLLFAMISLPNQKNTVPSAAISSLLLLLRLCLLLLLLLLFLALRSHRRRRLALLFEDVYFRSLETSCRIALLGIASRQRLPRARQFHLRTRTLLQFVAAYNFDTCSMLHAGQRIEIISIGPGQAPDDGRALRFGGCRRCGSFLRCKTAIHRTRPHNQNPKTSHVPHNTASFRAAQLPSEVGARGSRPSFWALTWALEMCH